MFSAIFSSPRCRKPMSGVALVMISPSSSSTSRKTPCVAGCDGPMLRTIFSPMSSSAWCSSASAATTRVTGSGDSISRVVKGMEKVTRLQRHKAKPIIFTLASEPGRASNFGTVVVGRAAPLNGRLSDPSLPFAFESPEADIDGGNRMKKIALLFAGQGAQTVGMGRDLAEQFPTAGDLFQKADDVLGRRLSQITWSGPIEDLTKTSNCQPALFVHGLACLSVLRELAGNFPIGGAAGLSV